MKKKTNLITSEFDVISREFGIPGRNSGRSSFVLFSARDRAEDATVDLGGWKPSNWKVYYKTYKLKKYWFTFGRVPILEVSFSSWITIGFSRDLTPRGLFGGWIPRGFCPTPVMLEILFFKIYQFSVTLIFALSRPARKTSAVNKTEAGYVLRKTNFWLSNSDEPLADDYFFWKRDMSLTRMICDNNFMQEFKKIASNFWVQFMNI